MNTAPSSADMLTALQARFGIEELQRLISAAVVRAPHIRRMEHVQNLYFEHVAKGAEHNVKK
jgi:hypothetical protein